MANLEVLVQLVLGLLQHGTGVGALLAEHQMRRQRDFRGAHGPDMQVMHFADARQREQQRAHRRHVNAFGDAVKQHVQRLPEQAPGAQHDHHGNRQAHHRVDPAPALPEVERPANHHAQRHQRVGGHVQKGTANVQVVLAAPHEQQCGRGVDHDADTGHGHDSPALGSLRRAQAVEGFPGQRAHGHQQQQGVEERRQNGGPFPAIGVARIGPQLAGQRAAPGQHQAGHIAQVVAGVGQQRQRVDLPAIPGLYRDKRHVERNADGKGPVELGGGMAVPVVVSGAHSVCPATGASLRRSVPARSVPGETVLKTVPYFLTLSCSRWRRWSDSSVSTMIS